MFSTSRIFKLALVLSFNFLEASANDITAAINDIDLKIDKIKNKYFLIRHDIPSKAPIIIQLIFFLRFR